MITVLLAFLLVTLIVAGMAVGVIFSNKPIKGSCGGIQAIGMGTDCDICGGDTQKCEKENAQSKSAPTEAKGLFYDAGGDQ